MSLAGMLGIALLGGWYAWSAVKTANPVLAVGAAAFLAAAPLLLLELAERRRERRVRYEATPRGVLVQARDQMRFARRQLRGCRWTAAILGTAALAVLLISWSGRASWSVVLPIAAAWGLAAGLLWVWQLWRAGKVD